MMRRTGVREVVAVGALVVFAAGMAAGQAAGGASGGGGGPSAMDTMLRIAGRTHPILVHFPIAMVLVAAMIETVRAIVRRPTPARTSINMLGIGVLAAAAAIGSGWLNGDYENHASNADTMELHRWVGIGGGGVALLAFLFATVASRSRRALMAFRALLLVAAGAIGFTGHLGGNMVYGEGYMLAPLKMGKRPAATEPRPTPPSPPPVSDVPANPLASPDVGTDARPIAVSIADVSFERDVLPIFVARCAECHGEAKVKGGLRLDSQDHVMGAESWVLSVDEPSESDLVIRVKMHEDDDGAMPPTGERLASVEIATIEAWIASLAMAGAAPEAMPEPESQPEATDGPEVDEESTADAGLAAWTEVQVDAIQKLRARGARIEPVSVESGLLDVNLSLMSPACDGGSLSMLGPVVGRIERLNLAGASVGSADLAVLAGGDAIRSIDLDRTRIDDGAAVTLAALPALETLIVTGTGLTDAGLRTLAASGSLKRVYAAKTGVTAAGAASVSEGLAVVLAAPERAMRVFLVRHAEKQTEGDDPGLTEQGAKRAQALMTELVAEQIRVVYVTQFARTQQTAQPLAEKLGLTATVMQASRDVAAHAAEIAGAIRALPRGQTVLVAGHSNTIPEIMRALGVAEAVQIEDSRYGDLYVVELESGGGPGATLVETRRFGD
jgi:broad specificity phosphatase PhoE/uncharacterized membrane protein/mono/diheme cytochrome c family protein